jgi:hypothetical protein
MSQGHAPSLGLVQDLGDAAPLEAGALGDH